MSGAIGSLAIGAGQIGGPSTTASGYAVSSRGMTLIANRALDAIAQDRIGSINDNTRSALLCTRILPSLRDSLLRRHPWNFARVRASLPALATTPAWGFAYAYALPSDYLRIIKLNVPDPDTPFKLENGAIVTDAGAPLGVLYIARIEDAGRFDPLFAEALVLALARDLAKPLANDTAMRQDLAREFEDALRVARTADAAEGEADIVQDDLFVMARR